MLAVGPEEDALIQPFFQCIQRFQDKRFIMFKIDPRIVAHTFKQAYFLEFHEPAAVAILYEHLVVFRERSPVYRRGCQPFFFVYLVQLINGICQSFGFDGLQEVIQGIILKSF